MTYKTLAYKNVSAINDCQVARMQPDYVSYQDRDRMFFYAQEPTKY